MHTCVNVYVLDCLSPLLIRYTYRDRVKVFHLISGHTPDKRCSILDPVTRTLIPTLDYIRLLFIRKSIELQWIHLRCSPGCWGDSPFLLLPLLLHRTCLRNTTSEYLPDFKKNGISIDRELPENRLFLNTVHFWICSDWPIWHSALVTS